MRCSLWWISLAPFLLYTSAHLTGSRVSDDLEIVFPERINSHHHKRDLSTNVKGGHEDEASFSVKTFKKDFILDTQRNKNLISPSFTLRHFNSDGSEVISLDAPDHCHYQGTIRGVPESTVVLNTCNGLRGLIDDNENTYLIEPHEDYKISGAHKLYQENDEAHLKCGNSDEHTVASDSSHRFNKKLSRFRRSVSNIDDVYLPYFTTSETRYNELLFVVDYEMYKKHGSDKQKVTDRVITLVNALDAIYQRINIRIVMSVLEIWTAGDRMQRQAQGGPELRSFKNYRKASLTTKFPFHDNAQFLSHKGWTDCAGMAYVTAMCGDNSCGVNAWDFSSIIGPYVTVAHEMGHNFGFKHDLGTCKCLTLKGCIMGGHKTRVPGFSNCSMIGLKNINDKCFYNVPTTAMNARCGNGIREGKEECDCGTPEMCLAKDPCCLPLECRLKPSSRCSDLHHSCCESCVFTKQGTLCRVGKGACDVPEYCPGDSRDCPNNAYVQDGFPCSRAMKHILGNINRYSIVRRTLSPRIEARYIRINPQYWNGRICMRTEFYGCSSNEVMPTSPTPIKAYNDYCVLPKSASCSPNDNTYLIYKAGTECKSDYMQFTLDENGILRHHCSAKKICVENGASSNGAKLVISSSCTDENSKFERTAGKSLKHKASGKCVHPTGGWPGNDKELLLWTDCDIERLQFWFMKPDCVIPLGMQNKAIIPDNSITASSSRSTNELPHFARLNQDKYWCSKENNKTQYLQVDLGKVQTISMIATQGRGTWYYWVSGYFVYYSQDGQQWIGYTESGDEFQSNSNCYLGKCQETLDTQCKDLWGPTGTKATNGCYDKLNVEATGYGTCDPATNSSCAAADVKCGQIQCTDTRTTPVVNYGWSYKQITLASGQKCSAAALKREDSMGTGMVPSGTKCGLEKMCKNYQCKSFSDLGITSCPQANNLQCAGRGVCTNQKVCHCHVGYDPNTACNIALQSRNGGYGDWSGWSACTKGCNGGEKSRHRFCNNPIPLHGGQDCQGVRLQEEGCNTELCPEAHSCRHLQSIAMATNKIFPDGVYNIYPNGFTSDPIMTYCDMSRDGGGWTLLVTSHTNTWTADNVKLRNAGSPKLFGDYSILKHGDAIKNNLNVKGLSFEYRLEAQSRGRWGGIWKADISYTFTATNNKQTGIELVTKFDNWNYTNYAIEKHMPWISGAKLTTSESATSIVWGTITGNDKTYHPAPWISGNLMEKQPEYIWYWVREGPWVLPRSCAEVQFRGYVLNAPKSSGMYTIKPSGQSEVKTYCDLTNHGGGWTLVATSATHTGWTEKNVKKRNADSPSLDADYSILEYADAIKDLDPSQDYFQYRIEADGENQYGGIWDAPRTYTFTSTSDQQTGIKLVKNFNSISTQTNLVGRMPRLGLSSDVFLTSASSASDPSGTIIYNSGASGSPSYIPTTKPNPGVVRYWMREGTRRSCNDITVHGVRAGQTYEDGFYMIRLLSQSQYLPVFCDMTSEPGAFTLIVTSRHNSWTRAQVPERNINQPSLSNDYSILKYADLIKNIGNNATFEYKLDANQRGHWGGVWTAPRAYTFMVTNKKQTGVTLKTKFDSWEYSWWKSLNKRMPWFDKDGKGKKALLTTSESPTYYPSGSILWAGTDRNPADWIADVGKKDPGTIWYWVNEDDCGTNRQPVHGGLAEWNSWGRCDKMCVAGGKQTRTKTCTNPAPKCGGNPCNPSVSATEERSCKYCPESSIKSQVTGRCVQPSSGSCSPPDGDNLIFKSGDAKCTATYQNFLFDYDGIIHHKCSGKVICPEENNPAWGKKLLLRATCDPAVSKFQRLPNKSLKNLSNGQCVHPSGGVANEGVALVYWSGCDEDKTKLDFIEQG